MVSPSVLLRGVNDHIAALEDLMRAFVECRIKPYYLHHGDLAPWYRASADDHGAWSGVDARACEAGYPDCVSGLRSRHSRWPPAARRLARTISCHIILLSMKWKRSRGREAQRETRYRVTDYCGDVHLYPPEP